jgi:hypothetical protein
MMKTEDEKEEIAYSYSAHSPQALHILVFFLSEHIYSLYSVATRSLL